jgi:hypothetical protein
MELLGDIGQVEAHFKWKIISSCLEIVLISTQDRCTVCAKHTIGSEIILGANDGTPTDVGQVETRFGPFEDSVNLDAR